LWPFDISYGRLVYFVVIWFAPPFCYIVPKKLASLGLRHFAAGLPDGFKPKIPILVRFGGLGMENVVIFYDHLEYFTAIWYNLLPFGIVCDHLVYFLHFGMFGPRKIWQPCFAAFRLIDASNSREI
jgi:hypothetical protein